MPMVNSSWRVGEEIMVRRAGPPIPERYTILELIPPESEQFRWLGPMLCSRDRCDHGNCPREGALLHGAVRVSFPNQPDRALGVYCELTFESLRGPRNTNCEHITKPYCSCWYIPEESEG